MIALCTIFLIFWVFMISRTYFGSYYFKTSENSPMDYFLFKENDRNFAEYYVNDYKYTNGFVYYTVIDGIWPEADCYFDPNLQLKRINLSNNQVETTLNLAEHQKIYQKLSKLSLRAKSWLNDPNDRCSVKYPKKWGVSPQKARQNTAMTLSQTK